MKKLRLAFMAPPHADWQTPANLTWMLLESHYKHNGKHADKVEFIPAPYKFDQYSSFQDIKDAMDCGQPADVYCFSSYVWNYDMCDRVAALVKEKHPEAILVIGGPHIGKNEPDLMNKRLELYNYISQITKPGEAFFTSLLDGYFNNLNTWPKPEDVTWEWRSAKQEVVMFPDYSVYREHFDYLKEMRDYAKEKVLEPFMVIESTRGCPYKCAFCEWGGGIGGKVYKKDIEVWKEDVSALVEAGYRDGYLADANFGAFKDRDIEIFRWSFNSGFNLTDISTMKSKDLKRRKDLVDAWFDVVGKGEETHSEVYVPEQGSDALFFLGSTPDTKNTKKPVMIIHENSMSRGGDWGEEKEELNDGEEDLQRQIADGDVLYISIVPTVSIQSASEQAMKDADRVDLSLKDKIALSEHINQRCNIEGYPKPPVEMILGMPGSTLEDFYKEYEIYWNFKSFGSWRHDYMFLPDSELSEPLYIEKHNIEIVECHTDVIEEGGAGSRYGMYRSLTTSFRTIASSYSYTREEMHEMWFMNVCGNLLLQNHYAMFEQVITPGEFCRLCYQIAKDVLPGFKEVHEEIVDILNPDTPPRSLKKIGDESRLDAVMSLFKGDECEMILLNELFVRAYAAA